MKDNKWLRLLTYVTGLVNQELLLQNEYLAAENKILRVHLPARLRMSDPERSTLAEIGKRLGRKALAQVACVAKPDTILAWYRRLIAHKFDGSKNRSYPGRPRIDREVEALVVQMARENSGWGYDRIAGALANLGYGVSDETVANILRRHGIAPAPKRSQNTTWREFIASHMSVLAGIDFFMSKCSPGAGWRPITFCFSFTWKAGGSAWPELRGIPTKLGCNKWRATPPMKAGDIWISGVMHCMIGTRNSVGHFGRRSHRAVSTRSNYPHGVQI
jgi:hypothetical protein